MTEKVDARFESRQPRGAQTAAILVIQLICAGYSAMNPAMTALQNTFADEPLTSIFPVTMVSTLAMLGCTVGVFITGAVGNKVKPKTMAIIASFTFTIAGCLPAFIYVYPLLLVCRFVCGMGIGLMTPLANLLILGCYKGDRKASLLGYAQIFLSIGSLALQTIVGLLATADATGQLVFISHLWGVPTMIMAFFLPDPDMYEGEEAVDAPVEEEKADKKVTIPASVWILAVIYGIFGLANTPTLLNCTTILVDCGLDTATVGTVSAIVLDAFSICGMIAATFYGKIFSKVPQFTTAIGFGIMFLADVLIFVCTSLPTVCIGYCVLGMGSSIFMPSAYAWIGEASTPESNAAGISAFQIPNKLTSFLSSYWLLLFSTLFGESVYSPGYFITIFMALGTILFIFYNPWKNKAKEAAAA